MGENMAVVAEGGPQGMYRGTDVQCTRASFNN